MELTYTIKTAADAAAMTDFQAETLKAIEAMKAGGIESEAMDAKLKGLEASVRSITEAFEAYNAAVGAGAGLGNAPGGAAPGLGGPPQGSGGSGGSSAPTAPPTPPAPGTLLGGPPAPAGPAAYDIVTKEQYDLLLLAKVAAEAYLKAVTDPTSVKDAKDELEKINDSLARSTPRAEQAADAYLRMHEALTDLSLSGQQVADAGQDITTNEQLKATEELLRLEKERLATQKPGSQAYAETKTRVEELTAAVNGSNAEMIRELELLKQKAVLLKQTGDAAGLAANKQQQGALKGALGQGGGLLDGAKEKGEELLAAYKKGGGGVEGFIGVLKGGGGALVGWAAGIGLMGAAMSKASEEFQEAQISITKLDAALAMNGMLTDENREKLHGLATQLEATTGVADDKWLEVQKKLIQFGADTTNMDKYTTAVKNLAGIMDGDVTSAATAVSRAMQGQFGMFSRYGIHVEDAGTQTEKMAKLFEMLAQKGGGQLEALGETVDGQSRKMANAFSNFWEGAGNAMGIGESKWRGQLASFVESFNEAWFSTMKPVDGLTNSVQTNKRSLEENQTAADNHKKSLESIGKSAAESGKDIDRMTDSIRKQARFQEELVDATLARDKAIVDADEKRGAISGVEATKRRMALDVTAENRKMKIKTDAKEAEKAQAGETITDTQAKIQEAEDKYKTGGEDLKKYLPTLRKDQATIKALDARIEEKQAERAAESKAGERNAQNSQDPRAAAAIRAEVAKEDARRAEEIERDKALREKLRSGADTKARAAGLKTHGISTDAGDIEADVKRLKEQMEKTKEALKGQLEKATKQFHDAETELVQMTEINKLRTQTTNLKNASDVEVAAANKVAENAVIAADQKKANVAKALADDALVVTQGGRGIGGAAKAALQRDLAQADLDAKFAANNKQHLESRNNPEQQRLIETQRLTLIAEQKTLNIGRPRGQQLTVAPAAAPTVTPQAGTPTVRAPASATVAVIDEAGKAAKAVQDRELAESNRVAAAAEATRRQEAQVARQKANEAKSIADYNKANPDKPQRAATYFDDLRAERAAEMKRKQDEFQALQIGAPGSASVVDTNSAERLAATSGAGLNAAVDRLAGAVVGPIQTASVKIDRLSDRLDILDQQMQDRGV